MKFLQEMIASKRASQQGLEEEISAGQAGEDAEMMSDPQAGAGLGADDLDEHEMQHDGQGFDEDAESAYEDDYEEEGDLFDDESYDWEFDGSEKADLSSAPAAPETHAAEDTDYEDEEDIDAGVANVLREVAGQTQRPTLPEPGEPAVASRLEENVERLRIQRKIWDLEDPESEGEANTGAAPADEASLDLNADAETDVEAEEVAMDDMDEAGDDLETAAMSDDGFASDMSDDLDEDFDDNQDVASDDFDMDDADDGEPAVTAAAASALRVQKPRVQSKAELRREPSVRREQAFSPRSMAEESSEQAGDETPKRRAGRVKTRLLGFHKPEDKQSDPFETAAASAPSPDEPVAAGDPQFPVGWLIVLDGPGRGASFTLTAGVSKVGRGQDQAIRLDYGDTSISRDNHAAIAYDDEQRTFFIGHGGKANLVRLNDMPVLSTERLADGDLIRIGETVLRFIALCGSEFSWESEGEADSPHEAAE